MLMRNPAFVQINQEISSPVAERKVEIQQMNHRVSDPNFIIEPTPTLPEEKGIKINNETPFMEDFEPEDAPRRLRVSAQNTPGIGQSPDINDSNQPDMWSRKSRTSKGGGGMSKVLDVSRPEDPRPTKQYPLEHIYDEKSFIKKNIDNYQSFESEENPNFFARDVFEELGVKPGYENDVVIERLKQRYEAAYRENFLLDKGDLRQAERNRGRNVNMPNNEFLSEEQFREQRLLGTLKSPNNANNLGSLDEEFGSESFREYKRMNSPGGVYAALRNGEDVGYLKPSVAADRRARRNAAERPHIPLFDIFEQEIYEIAATAKERLSAIGAGTELGSAISNKSLFAQKNRSLPQ